MTKTQYNRIFLAIGAAALVVVLGIVIAKKSGTEEGAAPGSIALGTWATDREAEQIEQEFNEQVDTTGWKVFDASTYGFKFRYPSDFKVGRFLQGEGEMIVVQNPAKKIGFQIYIENVEEDINMTPERIKQDIQDVRILDYEPMVFKTEGGRQGLSFISDSKDFGGRSREIWFTHKGVLYQISTYAYADAFLQKVLGTWEFYK